jgi:hypothetical protein
LRVRDDGEGQLKHAEKSFGDAAGFGLGRQPGEPEPIGATDKVVARVERQGVAWVAGSQHSVAAYTIVSNARTRITVGIWTCGEH